MLKAKNRKIAKITGEIQSAIQRVKNSASFSALGDVLNTLEGLLHKCKQMHAFQTLVNSSCPEPATFIECKAELKRLQVNIGKSYCELELKLQARQAMMRDDAASLCLLCMPTQPTMASLASEGYSNAELAEAAEAILVDSVLEVAGKLVAADVSAPPRLCLAKSTVLSIHKEFKIFAESEKFPVIPIVSKELPILCSFLDPCGVDVNDLIQNVDTVQNLRTSDADAGPFLRFLVDGGVGLRLIANAEAVCKNRASEVEGQRMASECREKAGVVVKKGIFHDVSEEADGVRTIYEDGLQESQELSAFLKVSDTALEAFGLMSKEKTVAKSALKAWTDEVMQDVETVWKAVTGSFRKMYHAVITSYVFDCLDAVEHGGIFSDSQELIDVGTISERLSAASVLGSELLKRPTAVKSKVAEAMLAEVVHGETLAKLITMV